jgi:hypothetical protein
MKNENSKQTAFGYGFTTADGSSHVEEKGLTKREYFAATAMQGLLSNPEWMKEYQGEKYLMQSEIVAEVAIKTADTILAKLSIEDGQ